MTNSDMELAIKIIRENRELYREEGIDDKKSQLMIDIMLTSMNYTETEIRYCYVLATGKNMIV
ncbi:TPA: hypothetical protein QCU10_005837 [Bacillus anthracis]|nr:hypothetical protein [Bacillus cereus biovar anthracis]HDR6230957.1 hypothetical protein [Bacillus cereus biovar anthracis]HDR6240484.1 hypothetical protein [Bacillus cereus biovar anthracis]HDR6252428.1 hypothetical protein [Bacillus cereus biovar anthracis]HDR6254213.1 hypothetical protein [Bacillus cereus biovar anthracis]